MNPKEKNEVQQLLEAVNTLRSENNKFREDVKNQIENINTKVDKKELPLSLEMETIFAVKDTLRESLKKLLSDSYNSPLKKYAENIISMYKDDIEKVFNKIISEEISQEYFYNDVKQALLQKIAKSVISGIDGNVDKVLQQMKQDPIFRSKLTLMVNNLIDEFLNAAKEE